MAVGNGSDVRVARYKCIPLLTVYEIWVADGCSPATHAGALEIIQRAAAANPSASFFSVVVSGEGNPRKSFDINLSLDWCYYFRVWHSWRKGSRERRNNVLLDEEGCQKKS